MADLPVKVVTIMDFPPEPKLRRMCYIFLDTVIAHGAKSITLLYEKEKPFVAPEHQKAADIEILKGKSYDVGLPHFNLRFKLPNLANLKYPFLFLDADMAVLGDLNYLWERRPQKPWIGIDHQVIPGDPRTHRSPFLNSGLQLVSDPDFYDLKAMLEVQNSAAPLRFYQQIPKEAMFLCPGADQAVLYRYFRAIGYDYRHPEIGFGWNSCAGVTAVRSENGIWKARTAGLAEDHDVYINHYWAQFKPWAIECPIYESFAWVDERLR